MSNKKMINQDEIDRILEYMNEHYEPLDWRVGRSEGRFTYGTRTISVNDMFKMEIFLSVFSGCKHNQVNAYLKSKKIEMTANKYEGCTIDKEIFSFEELKELESKAKELEQFTLNLGLWK